MQQLGRLIPRNLATRKARTLLTTLGIALGVAAVVASGVVRESATRSVGDMFDQAAGRAQLAVTNAMAGIVGGEGFDATTLERVRAVEGVAAAAPLLQVTTLPVAQLDDWEYSFLSGDFSGAVVYGLDPEASRAVGHYHLIAGEDLDAAGDNALLLTESYAKKLGVGVGDTLELVAPSGRERFTVIGLLAPDGLARLNRGQVGVTTLEAAQRAFERPERLDQVDVVVASGTDVEALKGRLQKVLGEGFRVFYPASKSALVGQMLQTITAGMGFIGTLALVVGGFLIFNTFAMTVAERTRELGLLRALGAGRGQAVGLVLAEATALGVVGAGLGVLLGLGLASGMREIAGAAVNNDLTELVLLPEHVILGLVVGVVVALSAALVPALRAGRLPVIRAIQGRRADDDHPSRWQVATGSILGGFGLAFTLVYLVHPFDVSFELFFLVLIALLVGVGLLIPITIQPLERLTGGVLGLIGVEGQLGARNLARSPGRAALTAGALMFGLVWVIAIASVFTSAKATVLDYLERTLAAELWVYAPQRLPRSLADAFEALPEVRLARPAASIPTRFIPPNPEEPEVSVVFTAIDPERSKRLDFSFVPGSGSHEKAIERLAAGGAVFIANPLREWYGVDVGEDIRLQTLQGPVDFEVAGVTFDTMASGYAVHGVYEDATRYFGVEGADIFAVNLVPDADPAAVGQRILNQWGATHSLKFETDEGFRDRTSQLVESFSALSNVAVLVGVVVAGLGVINTLLMNVLERRREIGMLRSLGMTQGQIMRLILAESAAMGGLGGLLGVVLGAWASRFAASSSAMVSGYDYPYVFPVQAVITCVVIALVVPLLAGLWPAWRGARANIAEAVRTE